MTLILHCEQNRLVVIVIGREYLHTLFAKLLLLVKTCNDDVAFVSLTNTKFLYLVVSVQIAEFHHG